MRHVLRWRMGWRLLLLLPIFMFLTPIFTDVQASEKFTTVDTTTQSSEQKSSNNHVVTSSTKKGETLYLSKNEGTNFTNQGTISSFATSLGTDAGQVGEQQGKLESVKAEEGFSSCSNPTGKFAECPSSYYKFDYVGKNVNATDISSLFQEGYHQGFTFFLNLVWYAYTIFIYAVIYVFRFSYDLDVMKDLTDPVQGVMNQTNSLIWGGVFPWMAGLAGIIVIWKFLRHKKREGFLLLFRNLSIVICASLFLTQMPTVVEKVSHYTGKLSDYTLSGFLSITPEQSSTSKSTPQNLTKQQLQEKENQAIERISSALWSEFYYKPYLVLQFGSIENGEKYVGQLFSYGQDADSKRKEWFTGFNEQSSQQTGAKYVDYDTGVAQTDEFKMVTSAGITKRFGYSLFIMLFGIGFSAFLVIFSWKLIKWFFLALGRTLLLVVPLVISMWPSRSFRDVYHWLFQIGYAFFMRILLACVLGIGVTLFVMIQGLFISTGGEFGWLITYMIRTLLAIAGFVAIWTLMKEVQRQLEEIIGVEFQEPNFVAVFDWIRKRLKRRPTVKIQLGSTLEVGGSIASLPEAHRKRSLINWLYKYKIHRKIKKNQSLAKSEITMSVNDD